ncbi:MAG: membrane protein insertase YidC [Candidatus Nanopelagicales bacterium]
MDPLFLLDWLRIAVSWILVQFHSLFSVVLDPASGWTWVMSIVGLVVVIRILLIPLFVKQIKAMRNMQLIHPQIKEIQKKYAGDRERQSQETMKLYRESGTNPLASCLPILLQAPIFFALFQVLQGIAMYQPTNPQADSPGVFRWDQYYPLMEQAHNASIFGVPLYGYFMGASEVAADGFSPTATRILSFVLIILMSGTTFLTQRQLIVKNSAPGNPMVRQQKILLYVFPIIFAVTGINFPIGVLIYWLTTNLWTMGQQFYVIRNNPQPGSPAFEAWEERKKVKADRKAARKAGGQAPTIEQIPVEEEAPARIQPKRVPKSKRGKSPKNVTKPAVEPEKPSFSTGTDSAITEAEDDQTPVTTTVDSQGGTSKKKGRTT